MDFQPDPSDAELRLLDEGSLVTRCARARTAGDDEARRAAWHRLVIRSYPRIRSLAGSHTFEGGGRLPDHQHDDAAQEAYLRAVAMGERFAGTSVGEFRAALKTCVWNACMDWGRSELARDKKVAGSLDEPFEGEEGTTRWQPAVEGEYRRREEERLEKESDEQRAADAAELVGWAIGQVENDGHRAVLELTYLEKLDGDAIAERLSITPENVYQRRRRGKQRMEQILRDHLES